MLKTGAINQAQHNKALTENLDIAICSEQVGVVSAREGKKTIKKLGIDGTATAWTAAVRQIEKWSPSFSDRTIFVVDSFTHAVRAISNFSMELNGKLNQTMEWRDFMGPQSIAETLMYIASDLPTHSIITAHQEAVEVLKPTTQLDDKGQQIDELVDVVMAPISIGKAGRVKLPSKMNHLLVASSEGKGSAMKRYIYTEPHSGVTTKSPFYGIAKERYPIEFALVEYFLLRG
jgi:hypothetical protein